MTDAESSQQRLDEVCDAFERAYRDGEQPELLNCLARLPNEERDAALVELLKVELVLRRGPGEVPVAAEYSEAIPRQAKVVQRVFASLDAASGDQRFKCPAAPAEACTSAARTATTRSSWCPTRRWRASSARAAAAIQPGERRPRRGPPRRSARSVTFELIERSGHRRASARFGRPATRSSTASWP